jgi:hypothetical protein
MAINLTVKAKKGKDGAVKCALKDYFSEKLDGKQDFYITKGSNDEYHVKIVGFSHPLIAGRYKDDIEGMPGVSKVSTENP